MRTTVLSAAILLLSASVALAGPQGGGGSYSTTNPGVGPNGGSSPTTTEPDSSTFQDFKVGGGVEVDSRWVGSAGHLISKDPHLVPWGWVEHQSGVYGRLTGFMNLPEGDFRELDPEIGWNIRIPETGVTLTPSVTYYARRADSDEWGISFYGEKSGFFAGGDYYTGMEENWVDSWFLRAGYSQTFQLEEVSLTPRGMISYGGPKDFEKSTIGELSIQGSHSAVPNLFVGARGTFPIDIPQGDEREIQGVGFLGVKF